MVRSTDEGILQSTRWIKERQKARDDGDLDGVERRGGEEDEKKRPVAKVIVSVSARRAVACRQLVTQQTASDRENMRLFAASYGYRI